MGNWTIAVFELRGLSAVIAFRLIILWLILFFAIYNRKLIAANDQIRIEPFLTVVGAAILHMAGNVFIVIFSQRFVKRNLYFLIFLFDVALISWVIYLTQGFESDLYLIYFLVIFMTALSRKPVNTFSVAGLGCLMYGFIFLKNNGAAELLNPSVIIRFPLFLIAALFSHIISSNIEGSKEDLTAQLKQIEKERMEVDSKLRFATLVSHELRSPLAVMKSGVNLVIDEVAGPLNTMQKEHLEIVRRNMDRLHALIDNVLTFAKLQSGNSVFKIKEGILNTTVREVCEGYRYLAEDKKITLELKLDPSLTNVRYDKDKIIQTLHNLVGNALKFTSRGGITVTTQLDREADCAVVSVKDTGPGISGDDMPKLFREFQQVGEKESGKPRSGTGLGLAICKEIIEGHGGKIWAESAPGKGAEFKFSLPLRGSS
ncbi:MAG: hypothetical protein A2901_05740 [Elusimicrobia bacterium RIFCSPLOWO2_01_FULL_54_10]|nr:MAG: hypothetical protein A2901_05740 [Elusimicrobia bacterium RIFCSPLOWO2_01_FULL_54_10]